MIKRFKSLSLIGKIGVGIVLLFACSICTVALGLGGSSDGNSVAESDPTAAVETEVARFLTEAASTEAGAEVLPTAVPTDVPPTAVPSNTPAPTATEIPAEPIVLTGTGDMIIEVNKPDDFMVAHITGNSASRYFSVKSIGSNREQIDLLVNTTDVYEGYVPVDIYDGEHTAYIQVEAQGDWTIELLHVPQIFVAISPTTIEGEGDYVFVVTGNPFKATIQGNSASRYFGVKTISSSGQDLLVNTTDPYSGSNILDNEIFLIIVTSNSGDHWTIILE